MRGSLKESYYCFLHKSKSYFHTLSLCGMPVRQAQFLRRLLSKTWNQVLIKSYRTNFCICLYKIGFTSKDIDILANTAHWMPLDPLVGEFQTALHFFPLEDPSLGQLIEIGKGHWAYCFFKAGSFDTNEFLIYDDIIIESSKWIQYCRILLVDKLLHPMLKFELIGSVSL